MAEDRFVRATCLFNFVINSRNEIFRNKPVVWFISSGTGIKFGRGRHRFEGTQLKVGPGRWVDTAGRINYSVILNAVPDNF